jgi:hypothetical protein
MHLLGCDRHQGFRREWLTQSRTDDEALQGLRSSHHEQHLVSRAAVESETVLLWSNRIILVEEYRGRRPPTWLTLLGLDVGSE